MSEKRPSSQAVIGAVIDALIERHGADDHADEVARARREFERKRGRVYEDQELWETWTQAFLEWYVVERVPPGGARPLAAGDLEREGDPRRAAALRAWLTSHRGLMEIVALADGRVEMVDILAGSAFSVAEKRRLHGVAVGDLAEVRLIGFEDDVFFGRTFCYHDGSAKAAILQRAEESLGAGGDRLDVLDACAAVRLRSESYRHVEPAKLYARAPTST